MEQILEYLEKIPSDRVGESWTLILYIMNDLGLSREEIFNKVMKARAIKSFPFTPVLICI
jgi:hypothetical protein